MCNVQALWGQSLFSVKADIYIQQPQKEGTPRTAGAGRTGRHGNPNPITCGYLWKQINEASNAREHTEGLCWSTVTCASTAFTIQQQKTASQLQAPASTLYLHHQMTSSPFAKAIPPILPCNLMNWFSVLKGKTMYRNIAQCTETMYRNMLLPPRHDPAAVTVMLAQSHKPEHSTSPV